MKDAVLMEKLSKLPENLRSEVADFVEFLLNKERDIQSKGRPVFGSAKGMFIMQPGFDEPLDDFKEYM